MSAFVRFCAAPLWVLFGKASGVVRVLFGKKGVFPKKGRRKPKEEDKETLKELRIFFRAMGFSVEKRVTFPAGSRHSERKLEPGKHLRKTSVMYFFQGSKTKRSLARADKFGLERKIPSRKIFGNHRKQLLLLILQSIALCILGWLAFGKHSSLLIFLWLIMLSVHTLGCFIKLISALILPEVKLDKKGISFGAGGFYPWQSLSNIKVRRDVDGMPTVTLTFKGAKAVEKLALTRDYPTLNSYARTFFRKYGRRDAEQTVRKSLRQ